MTFPFAPKAHLSSQALTSGKPYNHLPGWRAMPPTVSRDGLAQEDKVKAEPAKLADLASQTKVPKHCQHQRSLAPVFLEKPHCPGPSPRSPRDRRNMRSDDTYSEREGETPHVGCVPWGPVQSSAGGGTEVAQMPSDKLYALTVKAKRKRCHFQPTESARWLAKVTLVALCALRIAPIWV